MPDNSQGTQYPASIDIAIFMANVTAVNNWYEALHSNESRKSFTYWLNLATHDVYMEIPSMYYLLWPNPIRAQNLFN